MDFSASIIFVPSCSLNNGSHLSVRANTVDFARHAFPPTAVSDMESMGSPTLSHNMYYSAAHAMFYLVAGDRRLQSLNEMEAAHSRCSTHEDGLRCQISELENYVQGLEQKRMLLAAEKTLWKRFGVPWKAKWIL